MGPRDRRVLPGCRYRIIVRSGEAVKKFLKRVIKAKDMPGMYQELRQLERDLDYYLINDDALLSTTARHLLRSGGKRMRPAFFFLGSRLGPRREREYLLPLAMGIEMVHMASLVHDDVVDSSLLRHGLSTVKAEWGNQVSVYTGNYLLGNAMTLILSYRDPYINRRLISVATEMCRGELMQMSSLYLLDEHLTSYLARIQRKTAMLLSASCELGAYLAQADKSVVKELRLYGNALGIAFQIIDDILDYTPDLVGFGKARGGDVRQGLTTLPLIYAVCQGENGRELRLLFEKREKNHEDIQRIVDMVQDSGALEYCQLLAKKYVNKAKSYLSGIKESDEKQYFMAVADFVVERDF